MVIWCEFCLAMPRSTWSSGVWASTYVLPLFGFFLGWRKRNGKRPRIVVLGRCHGKRPRIVHGRCLIKDLAQSKLRMVILCRMCLEELQISAWVGYVWWGKNLRLRHRERAKSFARRRREIIAAIALQNSSTHTNEAERHLKAWTRR